MGFILKLLLTALLTYVLGNFLPGAHIASFGSAIGLVIVLALLNAFVKPILQLIGLPITIVTLGLFLLVINAVIVMIAASLLSGFQIGGFFSALLFSIVLSVVNTIVDTVVDRK